MNTLRGKSIVILGAGIIGLVTADRLLELDPNLKLTIISEKFLKETTSDGGGGLFRPDDRFIPGVPKDLIK
jgi:glycine/D-amino acid oxidase-like deaminating enzyme